MPLTGLIITKLDGTAKGGDEGGDLRRHRHAAQGGDEEHDEGNQKDDDEGDEDGVSHAPVAGHDGRDLPGRPPTRTTTREGGE